MPTTDLTSGAAKLRRLLWVLVAIAGLAAGVLASISHFSGKGAGTGATETLPIGGPFSLTAPDGSTVTERSLAGKPFAIFFGFTRCPDVCPTSLNRMAKLRKELGDKGDDFNIVFVSVDPGHDKPADIGAYVALFGTPIIGLTGTEAQLDRIKRAYAVYSAKVPQEGGDYTIDHTASIYLMDAKGRFAATIDYHEDDATARAKLQQLIGQL